MRCKLSYWSYEYPCRDFGAYPDYSVDLSLPVNGSINRASPAWTSNLLDLYINTIDAFSRYDNVLAYNVGNEIVTSANETAAATFVKAAARDVRAYLFVTFPPFDGVLIF
jgi:hypothetical protein